MLMSRFDRANQRVVNHPTYLLMMVIVNVAIVVFGFMHGSGLAIAIGVVLGFYYGFLLYRQTDRIIDMQAAKEAAKRELAAPAENQ